MRIFNQIDQLITSHPWRVCAIRVLRLTVLLLPYPANQGMEAHARLAQLPAGVQLSFTSVSANAAKATTNQSSQAIDLLAQSGATPSGTSVLSGLPADSAAPALSASPGAPASATVKFADRPTDQGISGIDPAKRGNVLHGSVAVNGFHVQLPAGEWMILASATVKGDHTGSLYVLGRIEHLKLVGMVNISAARAANAKGAQFHALSGCAPPASFALNRVVESNVANESISCWILDHFYTTPLQHWADKSNHLDLLLRAAFSDLAGKGVSYSQDYVEVNFARVEPWGYLQVKYDFDPASDGITSDSVLSYDESEWAPSHITRFPDKVAYAAKIGAWGDAHWPNFKQSFDKAK